MSEQPGHAAGTAGPEDTAATDLHKPWHLNPMSRGMILDAHGNVVAICLNNRRLGEYTDPAVAAMMARHIIACVNFCGEMSTELLEVLASGQFKIQINRISLDPSDPTVCFGMTERRRAGDDPDREVLPIREQLRRARESFVRDIRRGTFVFRGQLPGGAI